MPADVMGRACAGRASTDPEHHPLRRGQASCQPLARPSRTSRRSSRRPRASRGSSASGASHADRRHHEQRAAHRRHPDHEAPAGRAGPTPFDYYPTSRRSACQDGLPRAAQPHDPRDAIENVKTNRGEDLASTSLSKDMTDEANTALLARGEPSACSSSTGRHAHPCSSHAATPSRHLRRPRALPPGPDG